MKLFAKKSLGQHFLNSPKVLTQIVETAQIQKNDLVLEIGPGTGILTRALLNAGAIVYAVEKDRRALEMLRAQFSSEIKQNRLHLTEGDVLEEKFSFAKGEYSIVANIPYYITGAILEKFLEQGPRPRTMVLLVQKEVAERIVAKDHKESVLSISVKVFGKPRLVATVPPGAFVPPPTVDSAIVAIEDISDNRFSEKNIGIARFFEIVKAGFAHKRKFVTRNLEQTIKKEKIQEIWFDTNLDQKIRAEDISTEIWLNIASKSI